jgi:hypothetical protein
MSDRTINKLPFHFVDYLKQPGLDTMAGRVPLAQYVCLNKDNGGNARIDALVSALRGKNIKDGDSGKNIDAYVGAEALTLVWKGQGHANAFIKTMNFLCDNQDQFKGMKGELGRVYDNYFRENRDVNALNKMVADAYFGIDCIGFIANFLIYAGLWDKYYGYEKDQWDRVFTKNVRKVDDVRALNVMVWPGKHIAIIDWVHQFSDGRVMIDMCQSSTGGPQCNENVYLTAANTPSAKGYQMFQISGPPIPVPGHVYVMSWPNLSYSGAA